MDWLVFDAETIKAFAEIIKALAWPAIIFIILIYLMVSRTAASRIADLFRPFRSVKLLGTEFVLSEGVGKRAEEIFAEYREQVKAEYDRRVHVDALKDKLQAIVESTVRQKMGGNTQGLRCTVHVPDTLFAETLYQLLDYYPRGGGRGRTWSTRYGIIGKAWRLGKDRVEGRVPTSQEELIREWGLTKQEATAAGEERQSFACVILRDEQSTPVGIFYMDSKQMDAFGSQQEAKEQLVKGIIDACKTLGLSGALSKLNQELRGRGPLIRIHE